eukprot:1161331-Pelagomonas_calceolata.AAC.4
MGSAMGAKFGPKVQGRNDTHVGNGGAPWPLAGHMCVCVCVCRFSPLLDNTALEELVFVRKGHNNDALPSTPALKSTMAE